jgi:predicted RNA-binding Zn-ribbon protein involved in translation (DUF1610 family)
MMGNTERAKGTWVHRFAIRFFTVALAVLFFWLIGFFLEDIRTIKGPEYPAVEKTHLDARLLEKQSLLERQIAGLAGEIANLSEKQRIIGDSSRSLQQTLSQIIELQKQGLQKNVAFTEKQQVNFSDSLNLFLENQKNYQTLSQSITEKVSQKQQLAAESEALSREIEAQRRPAREEFERLMVRHRIRLASIQLLVLLPILLIAAALIVKKRGSLYAPLFMALGAAALARVAFVIHQYFPARIFRYALTLSLIAVVMKLLVHFIRAVAFPGLPTLARQYREAYERFLCPVCEYPIRIGPRRFLFWTRRTVNKIVVPTGQNEKEEVYSCPSCGSRIFEECPSCHQVRHAFLPYCTHCGNKREIDPEGTD